MLIKSAILILFELCPPYFRNNSIVKCRNDFRVYVFRYFLRFCIFPCSKTKHFIHPSESSLFILLTSEISFHGNTEKYRLLYWHEFYNTVQGFSIGSQVSTNDLLFTLLLAESSLIYIHYL